MWFVDLCIEELVDFRGGVELMWYLNYLLKCFGVSFLVRTKGPRAKGVRLLESNSKLRVADPGLSDGTKIKWLNQHLAVLGTSSPSISLYENVSNEKDEGSLVWKGLGGGGVAGGRHVKWLLFWWTCLTEVTSHTLLASWCMCKLVKTRDSWSLRRSAGLWSVQVPGGGLGPRGAAEWAFMSLFYRCGHWYWGQLLAFERSLS